MLIFYFDIDDGRRLTHDREGVEFADRDLARLAAIDILPNLARDTMSTGDQDISVVVFDESRNAIFTATLSLVARWLDPPEGGWPARSSIDDIEADWAGSPDEDRKTMGNAMPGRGSWQDRHIIPEGDGTGSGRCR